MKWTLPSGFAVLGLIALIASGWLILRQLSARGKAGAPRAAAVEGSRRVETPSGGPDERVALGNQHAVSGSGVVEPRDREVKVAALQGGLVVRLMVAEGQQVRRGQVLVEFDATSETAAMQSALRDLDVARADLAKVRAGERPETIQAAGKDTEAVRVKAGQSRAIEQRLLRLAGKDLATQDEYDRARRTADQDAEAAEAAAFRFRALANGPRSEDIGINQARVELAEARWKERQTAVLNRQVRAPAAGTVLQIKYRPGEYYTPSGEPLLLLADLTSFRARIDIDERDIAGVFAGQSAYVTAPAFRDRRFAGRVAEIGQRIGRKNLRTDDPKERIDTKILEVVIDLDEMQDLVPGLRVTAVIGGVKSK